MTFTAAATAVSAAFIASFVEVVEAFTIVLAASTLRGWRPALAGAAAGFLVLAAIVVGLGAAIEAVPLRGLQVVIGILLLLFGLRWLRKAILRAVGIIELHDEGAAFAKETGRLRQEASATARRADVLAGATAFKGVVLEGIEVVFIVLAVGGGRGMIGWATLGAVLAGALVVAIGAVVHRPLSRVPENALKFVVGVMLSAFGVFFTGEGFGAVWPGDDFALLVLAAAFALIGLGLARLVAPRQIDRSLAP